MSDPLRVPSAGDILRRLEAEPRRLVGTLDRIRAAMVGISQNGKYRHWEKLRHLEPPPGLSHDEWWLGIKLARSPLYRILPLTDPAGRPFVYAMPDEALELLHFVDQHASGEIAMPHAVLEDEGAKRQYVVNSLIEEAIRSSQLEGATTTRLVAKEMIRSGREPRDRSERMILNNYRALEFMRSIGELIDPDTVLRLHRILTEGTLDNPDAAGRLQRPGEDRVAVWDRRDNSLVHVPPPAESLPQRFGLMCRFANGEEGSTGFLHPVVRSILLHFWLAYDHPFEDGNGRTARALFYWSMRKHGYWVAEYLSISKILRDAPSKYARAFVYAETDERDTTYFVLHHLAVIRRAIEEFREYVRRKLREIHDFEQTIHKVDGLNHRQLALLRNAVRQPTQRYTYRSHSRSHRVSLQSARTDLLDLQERGLLNVRRIGRQYVFTPMPDLMERLR